MELRPSGLAASPPAVCPSICPHLFHSECLLSCKQQQQTKSRGCSFISISFKIPGPFPVPSLCPSLSTRGHTYPGLPLSIQRPPNLLLKQGICPLQSLVLPGQLAEPQVGLFSGCGLNQTTTKQANKSIHDFTGLQGTASKHEQTPASLLRVYKCPVSLSYQEITGRTWSKGCWEKMPSPLLHPTPNTHRPPGGFCSACDWRAPVYEAPVWS